MSGEARAESGRAALGDAVAAHLRIQGRPPEAEDDRGGLLVPSRGLERTHVARPWVGEQSAEGLGIDALDRPAVLEPEALEKALGEERDVLGLLPERRKGDGDGVDA